MEYVFGAKGNVEILKTKDTEHSDLTGFLEVEHVYPNRTIVDCFRVVRKLYSAEDVAGNCYDWYEIDRHYRRFETFRADDADALDLALGTLADQEYRLCLMELGL